MKVRQAMLTHLEVLRLLDLLYHASPERAEDKKLEEKLSHLRNRFLEPKDNSI